MGTRSFQFHPLPWRLATRTHRVAPQTSDLFGDTALLPMAPRHLALSNRNGYHSRSVSRKATPSERARRTSARQCFREPTRPASSDPQATAKCILLSRSCWQIRTASSPLESSQAPSAGACGTFCYEESGPTWVPRLPASPWRVPSRRLRAGMARLHVWPTQARDAARCHDPNIWRAETCPTVCV